MDTEPCGALSSPSKYPNTFHPTNGSNSISIFRQKIASSYDLHIKNNNNNNLKRRRYDLYVVEQQQQVQSKLQKRRKRKRSRRSEGRCSNNNHITINCEYNNQSIMCNECQQ